jgi:hypothetical protein
MIYYQAKLLDANVIKNQLKHILTSAYINEVFLEIEMNFRYKVALTRMDRTPRRNNKRKFSCYAFFYLYLVVCRPYRCNDFTRKKEENLFEPFGDPRVMVFIHKTLFSFRSRSIFMLIFLAKSENDAREIKKNFLSFEWIKVESGYNWNGNLIYFARLYIDIEICSRKSAEFS